MRIVHLTAGTGAFFCGTCLRDHALVMALRRQGHQVSVVPLYLPAMLEEGDAELDSCPIFFGGINVYLQQKSPLFRHTPAWIDRLFNGRGLLRWAAGRMGMTSASDLGEITLSMLRGERGFQGKELRKLAAHLRAAGGCDLISLSNALLLGVAPTLRAALGAPVACTLQGEDSFLDALQEPWRGEAWRLLAAAARETEALVAVSAYYGELMTRRLGLAPGTVRTVHNGLDLSACTAAEAPPSPPAVGYLARMIPGKGLGTLVEAFILLAREGAHPGLRLRIGGSRTAADEPFVDAQLARLAAAGLGERVDLHPNLSREDKQAFLRGCSVFSVPATYGEAFGLYLLEAMACGVPVVQPRSGAFPELVEATGGGLLCEPDDAASLAAGLSTLLGDRQRAAELGRRGRAAVLARFSADAMAAGFAAACSAAHRPGK